MCTLRVTLRCLIHPATLLSIGLLLVNDHWLKAEFPSWWTGKLSDFAGLFFFPFLLVPLFGLLLDRKNVSPLAAGRIAFVLTGIWFASIKTIPFANAATSEFLTVLLGHPVQLVLDPTDLIALPVLMPAWLLWIHEARIVDDKPSEWAWIALAVGVLATAATSPAPPIISIRRLSEEGGKLYAYIGYDRYESSGALTSEVLDDPQAYSEDGGRTWKYLSILMPGSSSPGRSTREACDPRRGQVCYRLGVEQIEVSSDGGKTFQVVWSIPWGRHYFIERENQKRFLGQDKFLDIGPYDLVFTGPVGTNDLSTVVFAMGNEGVLIRTPEGAWERYAVGNAMPSPFSAENVYEVLWTIPLETDIAAFLVLFVFSWLTYRAASTLQRLGSGTHSVEWAMKPLVIADIVLLVLWCVFIKYGSYEPYPMGPFWTFGMLILITLPVTIFAIFDLIPILFIICLGILIHWTWERIAQFAPDSGVVVTFRRAVVICISLGLVTYGPLVLWAFGIIPQYELAVAIAVVLGAVVIGIGIQSVAGDVARTDVHLT